MFWKKRTGKACIEDREYKTAVLKCSICNGEQVAGFKDRRTGKFEEIMLIRNEDDLRVFKEQFAVEELVKEY